MDANTIRKATERLRDTIDDENGWFDWLDSEDIQIDVDNGTIDIWKTSGSINVQKLIETLDGIL